MTLHHPPHLHPHLHQTASITDFSQARVADLYLVDPQIENITFPRRIMIPFFAPVNPKLGIDIAAPQTQASFFKYVLAVERELNLVIATRVGVPC